MFSYFSGLFHIIEAAGGLVRNEKDGRDLFNKLFRVSEQFLDVQLDYLGAIPFDEHVHKAVKKQKPVLISYPESNASIALGELAEVVDNWPVKSLLGGNTSFFLERLVAGEF